MKPEPLKKKRYCYEDPQRDFCVTVERSCEYCYHLDKDIKSAVKWLKKHIYIITDCHVPRNVRNAVFDTIDEAFEDVTK